MKKLFAVVVTFVAVLSTDAARAGGSSELVVVEKFERNGSDYVLFVRPDVARRDGSYADPYMGNCLRFEVRGTYSPPWGRLSGRQVTRSEHQAALEYLEADAVPGEQIELGWLGAGFAPISTTEPCTVRSRALQLWQTDREQPAVVSYHDAV